jgi:hypothetical protein
VVNEIVVNESMYAYVEKLGDKYYWRIPMGFFMANDKHGDTRTLREAKAIVLAILTMEGRT